MAIAKNPKRNTNAVLVVNKDREAEAFISGAGPSTLIEHETPEDQKNVATPEQNKKPIMIRIDPEILERIDKAAKRLGISRSAFIVSSAAERLEKME